MTTIAAINLEAVEQNEKKATMEGAEKIAEKQNNDPESLNGGKIAAENEVPKLEESCPSSGETEAADLDDIPVEFDAFESLAVESTDSPIGATKSEIEFLGTEESNSSEKMQQDLSMGVDYFELPDERPNTLESGTSKRENNNSNLNAPMQFPPNAFFIWARECHESTKRRFKLGFKEHTELRRKLGEKWRSMSKEEREPWEKKSLELRLQFLSAGNKIGGKGSRQKRKKMKQNNSTGTKRKCYETPYAEFIGNKLALDLAGQHFAGEIATMEELHKKMNESGIKMSPWALNSYLTKMKMAKSPSSLDQNQIAAPANNLRVFPLPSANNYSGEQRFFLIGEGKEWRKFAEASYERKERKIHVNCTNCAEIKKIYQQEGLQYYADSIGRAKIEEETNCMAPESQPIVHLKECQTKTMDHLHNEHYPQRVGKNGRVIVVQSRPGPQIFPSDLGTAGGEMEAEEIVIDDEEEEEKMEGKVLGMRRNERRRKLEGGIEQIGGELALETIKSEESIILAPKDGNRSISLILLEGILLVNGFVGNKLRETLRWTISSEGIEQLIFAIRGKCHQFFYLNPGEMGGEEKCEWMLRTN